MAFVVSNGLVKLSIHSHESYINKARVFKNDDDDDDYDDKTL